MRTEQPSDPLQGRRLLVAASGSIAAVKTPLLVSALAKTGAEVRCVVTPSAADLVSPVALASLSRHRCYQDGDEWSPGCSRPLHIELAEWAELVLVAPLSASTLARWTHGLADGLLASILLACECPVLAAAAMNTAMWRHPAVQANWQTLQGFPSVLPVQPSAGLLACDRIGDGRMADPQLIELAAASLFSGSAKEAVLRRDWQGRRLLVTAGATEERIDAARLLSNRSSGRMGVLMAQAARLRGAEVHLIHGPLQVPAAWLEGLNAHPIASSQDLERELVRHQPAADAVAMLAAVADLRRRDGGLTEKPSKQELPGLMQSGWQEVPDLLRGLVLRRPPGQRLLGFAALTGSDDELLARGEEKRINKGCDLLFVNPIDRPDQGFAVDRNGGWLLAEGTAEQLPVRSKLALAHDLLDRLLALKPCLETRPTSC